MGTWWETRSQRVWWPYSEMLMCIRRNGLDFYSSAVWGMLGGGALNNFSRRQAWPNLCSSWIGHVRGDTVRTVSRKTLWEALRLGMLGKVEKHGHFEDILKAEWEGRLCTHTGSLPFLHINPQLILTLLCASEG